MMRIDYIANFETKVVDAIRDLSANEIEQGNETV